MNAQLITADVSAIAAHRELINRIGARIQTVKSDRLYDAGQRIIDREWSAIERIIGARISSIPNDPAKPMCLAHVR